MEAIIYGSFMALTVLAFGARKWSNKSEKEKQSVSNVNFTRWVSK